MGNTPPSSPDGISVAMDCAQCGQQYMPKPRSSGSLYCSRRCCLRANYLRRKSEIPSRPCEHCGEMFQPATLGTAHCSQRCGRLAHAERIADDEYESNVDRSAGSSECHPWKGKRNKFGYGLFWFGGESLATRWAYKRYVGVLEAHEVVRHTCDNPPCQNRSHWLKGSQVENVQDCVTRGRTYDRHGQSNPNAKLTEEGVKEIRASQAARQVLADQYGVSKCTISAIKQGRTWKHI